MIDFIISLMYYQVWENEIWRYILFILLLYLTFPVSKVVNLIINKYLKKWAENSKTKFDDILISSLNPSITLFVFAGAFYFAAENINAGNFENVLTAIFNFLIIIPLVYFLIKFSTEAISVYFKSDKKSKRINEAGIDLLIQITRVILVLIGILLILANLGYEISVLLASLGVGGLAFALAAQDILKNFFAGISLVFDKTFNKGERVNFENVSGIIEELNLRTTKIRSYDGTLLTIPNAMLADNIVENVTKVRKVKVSMKLGVTYDTSVKKLNRAKEIIRESIIAEKLTDKESIWIWFDNFGDSSLQISVIYFGNLKMDDWPERILFKDRINFAIKEAFEKEKIEFAFPTQTIELKK